jgi:hypothetical protein
MFGSYKIHCIFAQELRKWFTRQTLNFKIMRTFDDYEKLALESKKFLFDLYVQEQQIELEYTKKGGIQASIEVYKWRKSELERIENSFKNQAHHRLFLESWSKGNFSSCDYHIDRF